MEVYFQLITDAETLKKACEDLQKEDYLGFDTETTALDPYDGTLRLVQLSTGRDTKVIDLKPFGERGDLKTSAELAPLRALLNAPKPIKIAHNAKFDAKWILHHLNCEIGGVFDTLLASQIIAAGDQDRRHSLADVTSHFLNTELDKSEQVSDWSAPELSQSQIEYAARDAATMIPLREKIVERLKSDQLIKVAKLEFDCVLPIAAMELNGFYLDAKCWREQLDKVKISQEKVAMELQQMLSAGVAQASLFGVTEINLDSQNQVTDALKNLGVPVPETTRGWQLQPLAAEFPVVAKLLEYRGVAKNLTSFGENILEFIKPQTGRIHADFRQIGAPTGRFSCVSEGTLIDVPGGRVPIERIKQGDLVYCYKENGEPTVRRVLNVFDNGIRDCVEIKWQSSGNYSTGSLVVTPDHKIRTKYKGWQEAQNLKRCDKLFHLRKAVMKLKGENFRVRLYGTNRYMELEEQLIKREYFRATSSMHIHHKNENKTDNRIENLEVLSASEHTSLHSSDPKHIAVVKLNLQKAWLKRPASKYEEENPLWKSVSRFGLLKMLAKAKGRPTRVQMDFETFKRKCRKADLSIKDVQFRYGANGIYLSDKIVLSALAESPNTCIAAEKLGVGTRRLKALCQRQGITYNHAVTSVTNVGKRRVYDLEIEGEHNFIANEICVHNCSKPNIQQIPHDENYRHCFRAPDGRKLIIADYCVAKGTRIATERGLVPIEEVELSDRVCLENGVTTPISGIIRRGKLPIIKLTLKNGYTLKATELHRIRVIDVRGNYIWRRIGELEKTDFVVIQPSQGISQRKDYEILPDVEFTHHNNLSFQSPKLANENLALFFGYICGDGSYSKRTIKWVVNQQDIDLYEKIDKLAANLFGIEIHRRPPYRGVFESMVNSTPLVSWCRDLNISKDCVPDFLWKSKKTVVAAFLRGLFESDGSVTNSDTGKVSLAASREVLARDVHQLLLALGIPSTLRHQKETGPGKKFSCWSVSIVAGGLQKFADEIGFISIRKKQKLKLLLARWTGKTIVGNMPNLQEKIRSLVLSGEPRRLLNNTSSMSRPVSIALAETIERSYPTVAESLNLKHLTQYKQLFLQVASIENIGEEEVFDLSVPNVMTYISDGFVSHNSQVELRILAEFSKDENFIKAFISGADFHTITAAQVFNVKPEDVTGDQRSFAKRLNFGVVYGIGSQRFALMTGLSQTNAEDIMRKYFATYRGLDSWLREAARKVTTDRAARTASGRLAKFRFEPEDRKAASLAQRNGKNMPIQGSSADILKRALHLLHQSIKGTSARLVNIVHDEIIVEADASEAQITADKLEKAMCAAGEEYISKVPVKVDVQIADKWAK